MDNTEKIMEYAGNQVVKKSGLTPMLWFACQFAVVAFAGVKLAKKIEHPQLVPFFAVLACVIYLFFLLAMAIKSDMSKIMRREYDSVIEGRDRAKQEYESLQDNYDKVLTEVEKLRADSKKYLADLQKVKEEKEKVLLSFEKVEAEFEKVNTDFEKAKKSFEATLSDIQPVYNIGNAYVDYRGNKTANAKPNSGVGEKKAFDDSKKDLYKLYDEYMANH